MSEEVQNDTSGVQTSGDLNVDTTPVAEAVETPAEEVATEAEVTEDTETPEAA